MTTGETVRECSRKLLLGGAAEDQFAVFERPDESMIVVNGENMLECSGTYQRFDIINELFYFNH
jgi:hypothetical protein